MRKLTKTAVVVASMAVMAMGATVMASAAQEGWVQSGSNWYYYINGNAIENQWMQAGDNWYFLGEDGKMVTNAFIQSREKLEDSDLDFMDATEDDAIYYVGSDGVMVKGWKEIDLKIAGGYATPKSSKSWYYFGGSGEMFGERWVQSGDKWYYLGEDGKMVKNNYGQDDNDNDCYLNGSGEWVTGWYKTTNDDASVLNVEEKTWVYFEEDGSIVDEGWAKINNKWYYFGAVSQSATDIINYDLAGSENQMVSETFIQLEVDDKINNYYVRENGDMATGWFTIKIDKDKNKYYADSAGVIQKDKVQTVSSKYYYLNEEGIYQENLSYAYSIKTVNPETKKTSTKDYSFDKDIKSLADAKDKLDELASDASSAVKSGETVTIYKLNSSSSYSYKVK